MSHDSPSREQLQARLASAEAELGDLRERAYAGDRGPTALALDAIREGFLVLDRDGRVTFANPAAERLVQKSRAELVGKILWELFPEAYARGFGREYLRAIAENVPVDFEEFYPEPLNVWYQVRAYPSAEGLSILFSDITDRRTTEESLRQNEAALQRANAELSAANEALRRNNETLDARVATRTADLAHRTSQLQALARDLARAEERERQRIAQVIHDQLQQLLSVARIKLGMAVGEIGIGSNQESLDEVDGLIAESLEITRSLTAELSPAILYRSGLGAALRWLGRSYGARFALTIAVDAEEDVDVEEEVRVTLFRSVRELLFNVVKHARVTSARVRLERGADGGVRIVVSDDGVGFDPEAVRAREGTDGSFGLFSLRERLEQLGGRLEVESAPGGGASFTIVAPLVEPVLPEAPAPAVVSTAPRAVTVGRPARARHRPARTKTR